MIALIEGEQREAGFLRRRPGDSGRAQKAYETVSI